MTSLVAGHTNSYHTYTFEESLHGIAAAGFRYAELSAVEGWADFVTADDDPAAVRAALAAKGLDSVSMSVHVNLFEEEGLSKSVRLIEWAGAYGLRVVNTALASRPTPQASTAPIVEGMRELGRVAARVGVDLGVEVHGDLSATGRDALTLVEEIGVPAVKINYDTGNVEYYGGIAAVDDLPAVVDRIAHIHLKDKLGGAGVWQFPALGGGTVDFARVLEIMSERDVQVPMSVELEFAGEPWPPLQVVDDAMAVSFRNLSGLGYPL